MSRGESRAGGQPSGDAGMNSCFYFKILLLGVSSAAVLAATAFAQDTAATASASKPKQDAQSQDIVVAQAVETAASPVGNAAVEQVLVTARRREENAQEVP